MRSGKSGVPSNLSKLSFTMRRIRSEISTWWTPSRVAQYDLAPRSFSGEAFYFPAQSTTDAQLWELFGEGRMMESSRVRNSRRAKYLMEIEVVSLRFRPSPFFLSLTLG